MRIRLTPLKVRVALLAALALPGLALVHGQPKPRSDKKADDKADRPDKKYAWTTDEALAQLALHPRDPYLQYVAMQAGRRENRLAMAGNEVESVIARQGPNRRDRRADVDLFSIFAGALAVQESLQLDSMRGPNRDRPNDEAAERKRKEIIEIGKLTGPTIKGHPWEKMLGDKKPEVDPLAKMVPADFYFVQFRSLGKLTELMESGDLWAVHLGSQTNHGARSSQVGERLRSQLALEVNKALRPLYDAVVDEVAVAGSDLFVAEGSDVTLVFRLKQPDLFKVRADGFLTNAEKKHKDAKRKEDKFLDVPYVHVFTPDRSVNVFSAYPEPNLHIRSNSKDGFFRVLEAYKGKTTTGKDVKRLGESTEFAYIRSIMPRGAKEEDGFVYLSDPFIRQLVGPQVKLTERRRVLCYNHLRMLGHASLLYQTEHGKPPASIDDLIKGECLPGKPNEGELVCMDGGKYTLSADGCSGVCSHHGHAHNLVPCIETPLAWVNGIESEEYRNFLTEYNQYWRAFFDPIAVRIQVTPQQYRLETIVLPLIDNSIYTGLAMALNGKPEPLDALPVPKRNIFSVAGRFNKEELINREVQRQIDGARSDIARSIGVSEDTANKLDVVTLIQKAIGNQVGFHIYDAAPTFDVNIPQLFGELFGSFNGARGNVRPDELWVGFIVASLTSPVYISVPVQDAKVVDDFLDKLDVFAAEAARRQENVGGWFRFEQDFYRAKLSDGSLARGYALSLGPIKWRFFYARIGDGFYLASKPVVLEDLVAAHAERAKNKDKPVDAGSAAHAMIRLRPANWNEVLGEYRLGWAENNRKACLNNQGPIASAGRAVLTAKGEGKDATAEELGKEAHALADKFNAVHFYCPEGGHYNLSAKDKTCSCSVHGGTRSPLQPFAPIDANGPGQLLKNFNGLTVTLTFLEDGLHAVAVIERK
jgi:hypothetical protein